ARACLDAGATPILAHHTTKPAGRTCEPLDLCDLAYAGIQEFAAQWLLYSRREPYLAGTGQHKLWLNAGGPCGQGGLLGINIEEGQPGEPLGGRRWNAGVIPAHQELAERKDKADRKKDDKRREQKRKQEAAYMKALDRLDPKKQGAGQTRVRDAAGMNATQAA